MNRQEIMDEAAAFIGRKIDFANDREWRIEVDDRFLLIARTPRRAAARPFMDMLVENDQVPLARYVWERNAGIRILADFPRKAVTPAVIRKMIHWTAVLAEGTNGTPRSGGSVRGTRDPNSRTQAKDLALSFLSESGWNVSTSENGSWIQLEDASVPARIFLCAEEDLSFRLPLPHLADSKEKAAQAMALYLLLAGGRSHLVKGCWFDDAPGFGARIPYEFISNCALLEFMDALAAVTGRWDGQQALREPGCAAVFWESFLGRTPGDPSIQTRRR